MLYLSAEDLTSFEKLMSCPTPKSVTDETWYRVSHDSYTVKILYLHRPQQMAVSY